MGQSTLDTFFKKTADLTDKEKAAIAKVNAKRKKKADAEKAKKVKKALKAEAKQKRMDPPPDAPLSKPSKSHRVKGAISSAMN
jgi:hypothetical protein